jgi:hypothetical protein
MGPIYGSSTSAAPPPQGLLGDRARRFAGALVQVLKGAAYGFNAPTAISSDGTHVWVANNQGNSVTELSATTGKFIRVLG